MKSIKNLLIGMLSGSALIFGLHLLHAQETATPAQSTPTDSIVQLTADSLGLPLISPDALPRSGTFFLMVPGPGGLTALPYPCPPAGLLPTYSIIPEEYLVDGTGGQVILNTRSASSSSVDSVLETQANAVVNLIDRVQRVQLRQMAQAMGIDVPSSGDFGNQNPNIETPADVSNYSKYMEQTFSLIDTNAAAANDTDLYNACLAFGNDTNTVPVLQIARHRPSCVLLKASHFDYSSESRDFCVLVCDKVETPLFKNIDIYAASNNIQNGGWLVQGSVPAWQVTDPMYLMVSNISRDYNAFFRVIPYSGPQIQLTGYSAYDVVSDTVSLQAFVTDLSGVTNEYMAVTVDGLPARYNIVTNYTISLDTEYNPNGLANVYVNAYSRARVHSPTNLPDNARLAFSGSVSLPLDFENHTYLAFASDMCSPDVGTNYIYFVIDKAQQLEATISDPASGETLAAFGGYVPYPATVVIPWNFTKSDGVTPYTNDTYKVVFTAFDPTTLNITNTIGHRGVRTGAGCFLTYQAEDPFGLSGGATGNFLNQRADMALNQTLKHLYLDLYNPLSLTQYRPDQVGANRNHSACIPLDESHVAWADFLQPNLSSSTYSDFTVGQVHCNGIELGGGGYLLNKCSTADLLGWLMGVGKDWRLRKAAIWGCYSGAVFNETGITSFADACGILPGPLQMNSLNRKNCGLFFGGVLLQGGFGGNANATADVAESLDQTWICGQDQYPGGCDPTYSFAWAINATRGIFNPELDRANPLLFGLPQVIYSSAYDDELMMLNFSHVKHPSGQ
jgi:hypothetical protein